MADPNDHKSSESNETKNDQITVEVDGEAKVMKADDVKNLIAQQAKTTQRSQQLAAVLNLADRYKVTPEQLVENFEGMAGVFSDLMDKGLVDGSGNILEPKVKEQKPEIVPKVTEQEPSRADQVTLKALLDPIQEQMKKLTDDNTLLMRLRLSDNIQAKFSNLGEEDVVQVFSLAERDRSKSMMQHAEDISKHKETERTRLEEEFAKKHGIDLEKVKEQKLFEQDPAGGAAALFDGKKISFKKDKGAVTPRQATEKFLEKMRLT
jgi:hypothetical protein